MVNGLSFPHWLDEVRRLGALLPAKGSIEPIDENSAYDAWRQGVPSSAFVAALTAAIPTATAPDAPSSTVAAPSETVDSDAVGFGDWFAEVEILLRAVSSTVTASRFDRAYLDQTFRRGITPQDFVAQSEIVGNLKPLYSHTQVPSTVAAPTVYGSAQYSTWNTPIPPDGYSRGGGSNRFFTGLAVIIGLCLLAYMAFKPPPPTDGEMACARQLLESSRSLNPRYTEQFYGKRELTWDDAIDICRNHP